MNNGQDKRETEILTPDAIRRAENELGIGSLELAETYILLSVKGLGPQKFKELHKRGLTPKDVISNPMSLPTEGKRGDSLRDLIRKIDEKTKAECFRRAQKQIFIAAKNGGKILLYKNPYYPKQLFDSNYPVPVLYIKGHLDVLKNHKSVACVGSRKIRLPYSELQQVFSSYAAKEGFTIISGFALGADTIAHKAAVESGGATVGVMPSGLDRPFPPENKTFWHTVAAYTKGIFVSEFPFGTGANSLNLKKRNKMIAAFSQGVLVAQSATDGGAMNAYRFAREQKKPVATFAPDEKPDTTGNALIKTEKQQADMVFSTTGNFNEFSTWLARLSFLI